MVAHRNDFIGPPCFVRCQDIRNEGGEPPRIPVTIKALQNNLYDIVRVLKGLDEESRGENLTLEYRAQ